MGRPRRLTTNLGQVSACENAEAATRTTLATTRSHLEFECLLRGFLMSHVRANEVKFAEINNQLMGTSGNYCEVFVISGSHLVRGISHGISKGVSIGIPAGSPGILWTHGPLGPEAPGDPF